MLSVGFFLYFYNPPPTPQLDFFSFFYSSSPSRIRLQNLPPPFYLDLACSRTSCGDRTRPGGTGIAPPPTSREGAL